MGQQDLMSKIVSLCKRRGFVFQSSEIYGGLKSSYDYGPLGVELKRNIAAAWWRDVVTEREDVVGLDASIVMHPKVWQTSGHVSGFSDPLVDCFNCKERFRADKAPKAEPGSTVKYREGGRKKGEELTAEVSAKGYICPVCSSPKFSEERQFNGMFKTALGPLDPLDQFLRDIEGQSLDFKSLKQKMTEAIDSTAVYLRPETAQSMFVQFANIQQTSSMKIPFGIAQQGKSFRNEILVEHFIFRSCEFEQMEMEFFVEPGTQGEWLEYWSKNRLEWYQKFSREPAKFRLRKHDDDELAHYADNCYDVEYEYPWGFDELEGVASRTDYDLKRHSEATGAKLSYFDQTKTDPETGKNGWRFTPYVIEPAAGLTRTFLAFLLDAYCEESGTDKNGNEKTRVVLKLHPSLAPIKVAVLPLMKKDGHPEKARELVTKIRRLGLSASYDDSQAIGKRYAKHDEIGTPFCITIDGQTIEDGTVTLRDRDTTEQKRLSPDEILKILEEKLKY